MLYTDVEKMREDFERNEAKFIQYAFYGGRLNGRQFNREQVEAMSDGHTPDYSLNREMGGLCPRKELDNQPRVNGYIGPMWDSIRCVMKDGTVTYDFMVIDQSKVDYSFAVLRYETQNVYEQLSE